MYYARATRHLILYPASVLSGHQNPTFSAPSPLVPPTTGKPYSSRHVTQELQIRTDGTRICAVPQITMSYRDSTGRTRVETSFVLEGPDGKSAPSFVRITDPSAQIVYNLDMAKQIAYRIHTPKWTPIPAGQQSIPEPPNPAINQKKETLGTHLFQGVNVEGTLFTFTGIPRGSTTPISSTNEIWIWPYLSVGVLAKSVNPGSSKTDAWLQLSTAEPDPALFRVPDGWKIVEADVAAPSEGGGGARRTSEGFQYTVNIIPPKRPDAVIVEAPYSAEQNYERTISLTGPKISLDPQVTKLYRDREGRTRIERPMFAAGGTGPGLILPQITDPVDEVQITLDPMHRIAHRFTLPEPTANPPQQVATDSVVHPHSIESEKDLGESSIEGLKATGTIQTYRTPAGANGNDKAVEETIERWFSPTLKMLILIKRNETAENSVTRLTHISTDEPDPDLLKIPDGYAIVDEKAPVTITITR